MKEAKFTKSLTVALPIDVYQKIKKITDDGKISMAHWVRKVVNMALEGLLILVTTSVRSRLSLQAENAALRNQLYLYRKSGQRPRFGVRGEFLLKLLLVADRSLGHHHANGLRST